MERKYRDSPRSSMNGHGSPKHAPPMSPGGGTISRAMGTKLFLHPGAGRIAVLMVHQDGGFDTDGVAFGEHWWYRQRSELLFAK